MRRTTTTPGGRHRGSAGIAVVVLIALAAAVAALFKAGADGATVSLFVIGACLFGFGLIRRPRSRD